MLETRPTDAVYARLSHMVYLEDGGASSPLMPAGWYPLSRSSEDSGYVGYVYKHVGEGGEIDHLVVAHRGEQGPWCGERDVSSRSVGTLPLTGLAGYQASLGRTLKRYKRRYKDAKACQKSFGVESLHQVMEGVCRVMVTTQQFHAVRFGLRVREAYPDVDLSFTGHGLGGWFAQLCVYHLMYGGLEGPEVFETGCVVFDSPGVRGMLEEVLQERYGAQSRTAMLDFIDGLDVMHYVTAPNLINACNEHIGTLRRLYPEAVGVSGASDWLRKVRIRDVETMADCFDGETGLPRRWREVKDWPMVRWPASQEVDVVSRLLRSGPVSMLMNVLQVSGIPSGVLQLGLGGLAEAADGGFQKLVEQTRVGRQSFHVIQGIRDWFDGGAWKDEYEAFASFSALCDGDDDVRGDAFERQYVAGSRARYKTVPSQSHIIHLRHGGDAVRRFLWGFDGRRSSLQAFLSGDGAGVGLSVGGLSEVPVEVLEMVAHAVLLRGVAGHLRSRVAFTHDSRCSGLRCLQLLTQALQRYPALRLLGSEASSDVVGALQRLEARLAARQDAERRRQAGEFERQYQVLAGRMRLLTGDGGCGGHEQLKEGVVDWLRSRYQSASTIQPLFGPPIALDEQHVAVQLLRQRSRRKGDSEGVSDEQGGAAVPVQDEVTREGGMGTYEQIVGQKQPMGLQSLFGSVCQLGVEEEEAPKLVLIQGRAGIGKTVLTRYLCAQWSRGELLQGFEWVFYLRLRDLRDRGRYPEGEAYNLEDWVYAQYWKTSDTGITRGDFGVFFREVVLRSAESGKVLVMLDGLDEVPSHHACEERLASLLSGESGFHVLVTSRPYAVDGRITRERRDVEVMGFLDADVRRYMDAYYRKSADLGAMSESERLLLSQRAYGPLRSHPVLWPISHVPVVLNILCGVLKDEGAMDALLGDMDSLSSVYQLMECGLLEAAYLKEHRPLEVQGTLWERSATYREHAEQTLQDLEQVAFRGLQQASSVLMSEGDIKRYLTVDGEELGAVALQERLLGMKKLGVLHVATVEACSGGEGHLQYEFFHLSFQEYFAGRYLVRLCREVRYETLLAVVSQSKMHPRYQVLYWMAAGQLKHDGEHFDRLMRALWSPPRDIFCNHDVGLMVRCCDEAWEVAQATGWVARLLPVVQERLRDDDRYFDGITTDGSIFQDGEIYRGPVLDNLRFSQNWLQLEGKQDILRWVLKANRKRLSLETTQRRLDRLRKLSLVTPGLERRMLTGLRHASEMSSACQLMHTLIDNVGEHVVRDEWITALLDCLVVKNAETRRAAAMALNAIRPLAPTPHLFSVLLEVLRDDDRWVQGAAVLTLGSMGEGAATAQVLSALTRALKDPGCRVKALVPRALALMGASAATPEVLSALIQALDDHDWDVPVAAVRALGKLGEQAATPEVISALLKTTACQGGEVREEAVRALAGMRQALGRPAIASVMMQALENSGNTVQVAAIEVLSECDAAFKSHVVPALLEKLQNKDSNVRAEGAKILGKFGERAATPEVLSALRQLLWDKDAMVQNMGEWALRQMGAASATPDVLSRLVEAMGDTNEDLRASSVRVLQDMAAVPAKPEIVSALLQALLDEDWRVRGSAAQVLRQMGKASATPVVISALLQAMGDTNEDLRASAVEILRDMGPVPAKPEIVSALLQALLDEDWHVRGSAAQVLGNMSAALAMPGVVTALLQAVQDKDAWVRRAALKALSTMGEELITAHAVLLMALALGDEHGDVRAEAAEVLTNMGRYAHIAAVVAQLRKDLSDENMHRQIAAALALSEMGVVIASDELVPVLARALRHKKDGLRAAAAKALGQMGRQAATVQVVSHMLEILEDRESQARAVVAQALGLMGASIASSEVLSALVEALWDKRRPVRAAAAEALGKMGEAVDTQRVVSELLDALRDKEAEVRAAAAKALGKMGEVGAMPEVFLTLAELLRDRDEAVRVAAAEALNQIGEIAATPEILARLVGMLRSNDFQLQTTAAEVLGEMGQKAGSSPHIVSALAVKLTSGDNEVQEAAARALGLMGEAAATPEVVSGVLHCILRGSNPKVRSAAHGVFIHIWKSVSALDIVLALIPVLESGDQRASTGALLIIEGLDERAATPQIVMTIRQMMLDTDTDLAAVAAKMLGVIAQSVMNSIASTPVSSEAYERSVFPKLAMSVLGLSWNHDLSIYPDHERAQLIVALGNRCWKISAAVCQQRPMVEWLSQTLMRLRRSALERDEQAVSKVLQSIEGVFASEASLKNHLNSLAQPSGILSFYRNNRVGPSSSVQVERSDDSRKSSARRVVAWCR